MSWRRGGVKDGGTLRQCIATKVLWLVDTTSTAMRQTVMELQTDPEVELGSGRRYLFAWPWWDFVSLGTLSWPKDL